MNPNHISSWPTLNTTSRIHHGWGARPESNWREDSWFEWNTTKAKAERYHVPISKAGLGFTAQEPIQIHQWKRKDKTDAQYITVEEFDDSEEKIERNENRISVFDRIEAPKPLISVFERLKSYNQA